MSVSSSDYLSGPAPLPGLAAASPAPMRGGAPDALLRKRRAQRRKMFGLIAVSYLIDSAILAVYAAAGVVGCYAIPLYAGVGLLIVGVKILLSDIGVNDRFSDHYLLIPVAAAGYLFQVGAAALAPEAAFLFLFNLFIVSGFTALRADARQSAAIWTIMAAAIAALFAFAGNRLAMPVATPLERLGTALAVVLGLGRFMYLGNYSNVLRESLYRRTIELQKAYERIEELAEIDELTGAYNRRSIMRMLDQEMQRAQRQRQPVSVALIDLDWFKHINDRYGHPTGDEVLRTFAISIYANIRDVDRFGRYGGEEFLLILPATATADGVAIVDRLRHIVATLDWSGILHGASLTLSAGVAELEAGETADALLTRADRALYAAKHSGRNCIVAAEAGAWSPPLQPQPEPERA